MRTYSGLDSGVKLDMSSDVGTKKRRGKAESKKRGRKRRTGAVNLDDRLLFNYPNYKLSKNLTLLNTATGHFLVNYRFCLG